MQSCQRITREHLIQDMAVLLMRCRGLTSEEANAVLGAIGDLMVSTVVNNVFTYRLRLPRHLLGQSVPVMIAGR